MKPPNVKYVYPLRTERKEVDLPADIRKAIVVFNVESDRVEDMMHCDHNKAKLLKEIQVTASKDLTVVVLAPPTLAAEWKTTLGDKVTFIETTDSSDIKLKDTEASSQVPMYWVGSCTQNNFISGIGEHNAMFVGYAKNGDKTDQNTQKYNCHKIAEF
jgi:hypothetical protein